jgi:hypothetical protein
MSNSYFRYGPTLVIHEPLGPPSPEAKRVWREVREAKARGREWVRVKVLGSSGLLIRVRTDSYHLGYKLDPTKQEMRPRLGPCDRTGLDLAIYLVMVFEKELDRLRITNPPFDEWPVYAALFSKRKSTDVLDVGSFNGVQQKLLRLFAWLVQHFHFRRDPIITKPRAGDLADGTVQQRLLKEMAYFKASRRATEDYDDYDINAIFCTDDDVAYDDDRPDMSAAELARHFEDRDESDEDDEHGPEAAGFGITEIDPEDPKWR